MFCKDDSLDYLNHLGYNVVKLPREKIEPLLVIAGKKQGLEVLGPLSHFVVDASSIPPVKCNEETAEISSMKTNKLDSSLGIDLMNTLLSAMGAAGGKVNLGYQKTGQIEITFDNVLSDYVYPTDIDDYLLSGKQKAF